MSTSRYRLLVVAARSGLRQVFPLFAPRPCSPFASRMMMSTSSSSAPPPPHQNNNEDTRIALQQPMHMNLHYQNETDEQVISIVRAMVPAFQSSSDQHPCQVDRITGGITNKLFKCSVPANSNIPSVLVRVFGGEGIIDRNKENATVAWLAENGLGPKYYGRFANGRIEGFFEGATVFSLEDLSDAVLSRGIATELAAFHKLEIPDYLEEYYTAPNLWTDIETWLAAASIVPTEQSTEGSPSSLLTVHDLEMYANLPLTSPPTESFLEQACRGASNPMSEKNITNVLTIMNGSNNNNSSSTSASSPTFFQSFDSVTTELTNARSTVESRSFPVSFCHNDVLCGNVMKKGNKVVLIDFEYGGTNYRGFDIANHFNEWAGGTLECEVDGSGVIFGYNGVPDYQKFPSPTQQEEFCRAYLSTSQGISANDVNEQDISALMEEVQNFVLVNHLYWGLWAVCRAFEEGCTDFNYMTYATYRIGEYYKLRCLELLHS